MVAQDLRQLRLTQGRLKRDVARGLRLGLDVWEKFEQGAILTESLTASQVERLAAFFQTSSDQFVFLLRESHPPNVSVCQKGSSLMGIVPQTFALALTRSAMPQADRQYWMDGSSLSACDEHADEQGNQQKAIRYHERSPNSPVLAHR